jgi:hypothetical protein
MDDGEIPDEGDGSEKAKEEQTNVISEKLRTIWNSGPHGKIT